MVQELRAYSALAEDLSGLNEMQAQAVGSCLVAGPVQSSVPIQANIPEGEQLKGAL